MPVRNLRRIKPKVWIPPKYNANYKVTVTRKDGTVDDITLKIAKLNIEEGVTDSIGTFSFEIYNPNENYTGIWTGNEIFRYYSAYSSSVQDATGLIHHYKLNGNSTDSAGSLDGTDSNMTYVSGKIGNAGDFNGTTSKIILGGANGTFVGNAWTIAMWFNCDTPATADFLFACESTGPADGDDDIQIRISSSQLLAIVRDQAYSSNTNQLDADGGGVLVAGIWYHVAVTWDGTTLKLYKDGSFVKGDAIPAITMANTSRSRTIGHSVNGGAFFQGLIDDFRVYDTALSLAEIGSVYNSGDGTESVSDLRFRGRVEKVSYSGKKIKVNGRSEGVKLMDVKVTETYSNTECGVILKDLATKYAPFATVANVNTSTTTLTLTWTEKPFWTCIKELGDASGFDCYLDKDLDFHFFKIGSVINKNEGIVHNINLFEVGDFGEDLSQVKNKITVYGAERDGIQVMYTAESLDVDFGVNSDFGVREEIVNDDSVVTETQAQELAEALLDKHKNPPVVGEVKGKLLATVQPGESIRLSSPINNLPPGEYQCADYKHTLNMDRGMLTTTVTVSKEPRKIYHIMKTLIEGQNKQKKTSINPYKMKFSYNFLFDNDSGTHSDTEISNGVLKLQSGKASGVWRSVGRDVSSDVTAIYLIVVGETLDGALIEVSCNHEVNYQTLTDKQLTTMTTAKGDNITIKVTLSNADTQIDSLSLQYKT